MVCLQPSSGHRNLANLVARLNSSMNIAHLCSPQITCVVFRTTPRLGEPRGAPIVVVELGAEIAQTERIHLGATVTRTFAPMSFNYRNAVKLSLVSVRADNHPFIVNRAEMSMANY